MSRAGSAVGPIEKLAPSHVLESFDCGKDGLNRFLKRHAWSNQQSNSSQTYVALDGSKVIGFYSLSVGSVMFTDVPSRVAKGQARHPVPVMLLARLAVDNAWQGKGVGSGLLKNALLRTVEAADIAGVRAMLVHAKDEEAMAWYQQFDVAPSPTDPCHLFLLMKDIKALLVAPSGT